VPDADAVQLTLRVVLVGDPTTILVGAAGVTAGIVTDVVADTLMPAEFVVTIRKS
jgi:hypothetical protein